MSKNNEPDDIERWLINEATLEEMNEIANG